MPASDPLFDLIHSLTKEQKRQFRIYTQKYDRSSKYLKLFDLLSKQEEYDTAKLKKQWRELYPASRLAVSKEYLTELILKSIRDTMSTSPETVVQQLLQDIRNLLDRRLYGLAKKRIARAEHLALEFDLIGARFSILALETYLPDRSRKAMFEKERCLLDATNQIVELGAFAEFFRVFSEEKGRVRSDEDKKVLCEMVERCPYPDPDVLTTFSAKLRYHFAFFKYYELTGNRNGTFKSLRQIVQLYDQYPSHLRTQQLAYISTVLNVCTMELYYGDRTAIPGYLKRLERMELNGQMRPYLDLSLLHFKAQHAVASENWKELDILHDDITTMIEQHSEANSFGKDIRIDFYLLFARAYFLKEEYQSALSELNKIFSLTSLKDHNFQAHNARILLLLTHYELGNLSYLPYLIRSTYRCFLRSERLYPFESSILKFLSSLAKIKTRNNLRSTLKQLFKDLNVQTTDGYEFPWKKFYVKWIEKTIESLGSATKEIE